MLTATVLLLSAGVVQTTQAPDSGFTIPAIQTETPPEIDGVISDGEWLNAAHATDFIRFEPQRGTPSPWRTDAMVLYDSTQIYVAFVVWDPDAPAAQLTRRDAQLLNDDAVVLILDTHNDKQSAYYFMTNLLGTQTDGRVANDGRTVDATWDAAWQAAFTRDPFLRVFFQTNSSIDRNNIQAVFVYRYKPPFGTLQLAYQRGTAEFGQASTQANTIFLKATLVF